jgi:hypothetical protein
MTKKEIEKFQVNTEQERKEKEEKNKKCNLAV